MTAQQEERPVRPFLHYDCMASAQVDSSSGADAMSRQPRRLPTLRTQWDSTRVYRQAVVLVSFADQDFSMDDPKARYELIFNEPGYNEGKGAGCVADYFRCQSGGLFRPEFDIYGPVRLSGNAKGYGRYGASGLREALQTLVDSLDTTDFSVYDWDGDGEAEQVIFVYAGYGGNEGSSKVTGCVWPNTSTFTTVYNADRSVRFRNYTASAELWSNDKLCGIGTICHEFTHSLGLPDIYPTVESAGYSIVDEWDLMDGGNFINNGWCPPNYTGMEKMLLGWATPIELSDATSISNLQPVSEGGLIYQVKSSNSEYYLLENRQRTVWDSGLPGHGLVVFHVDYNLNAWSSNTVNNTKAHRRFQLVHADSLDYDAWDEIVGKKSPYVEYNWRSRILSTSPYPYVLDGDILNDELTDTSEPPAAVFAGDGLMGKPITNIREDESGRISFDFMGGDLSTIERAAVADAVKPASPAYDLLGRRATTIGGVQIRDGRKQIKH